MPLDITNPKIINFLVESYDKTARLRMKWNELHAAKLKETATFRGPEKGHSVEDVAKAMIVEGMAAISRDHISASHNRRLRPPAEFIPGVEHLRKTHSIADVGLGEPKEDPRLARPDADTSPDPVMRPIPPEQKQIIYAGLPYFGREEYLRVRNRIKPEDKYYFQETMGCIYGWRLKDSCIRNQASTYGKTGKVSKHKCRSGAQPDPAHYKDASQMPNNKCPPT